MVKASPADAQERLIPASEVANLKWLPRRRGRNGKSETRLNTSTVYRWILSGANGVRLRACRVGGTWCTTESWLRAFFDDAAAAALKLRPATDAAEQTAAERKLKAAGAM